jgi:hypothetical protein
MPSLHLLGLYGLPTAVIILVPVAGRFMARRRQKKVELMKQRLAAADLPVQRVRYREVPIRLAGN